MPVERMFQVWYVYDDGREGCMSRPDEPMTHEHALRFRKGCMQGVKGRRLELREVDGLVARETERRWRIWVGYKDGREGYLNRPDKPLTYEEAVRFTRGMVGAVEGRWVEIREVVEHTMKVREAADEDIVKYKGKAYKVSKAATGFRGEGDDLPTDQVSLCGDEGTMEVDPGTEVEWMFEADC